MDNLAKFVSERSGLWVWCVDVVARDCGRVCERADACVGWFMGCRWAL